MYRCSSTGIALSLTQINTDYEINMKRWAKVLQVQFSRLTAPYFRPVLSCIQICEQFPFHFKLPRLRSFSFDLREPVSAGFSPWLTSHVYEAEILKFNGLHATIHHWFFIAQRPLKDWDRQTKKRLILQRVIMLSWRVTLHETKCKCVNVKSAVQIKWNENIAGHFQYRKSFKPWQSLVL